MTGKHQRWEPKWVESSDKREAMWDAGERVGVEVVVGRPPLIGWKLGCHPQSECYWSALPA